MTLRLETPRPAWNAGDDIASLVTRYAQESPERIALWCGDRSATWGELDRHVERVASALRASGVRPGHRVAILGSNSIEYVEVFLGALRARTSVVPLPTLASPAALSLMIADSTPTALFVDAEHLVLCSEIGSEAISLRKVLDLAGYQEWRDAAPRLLQRETIEADDPFDVIYSSGTTGVPKGIVHSHGARRASYFGERAGYFSTESVNVIATPFYSNTTSITWLLTTAHGGCNVILRKFSAAAFVGAVQRHRATHAMLVPVQYDRFFGDKQLAPDALSTMRFLFSTSAPLRAETKQRILDKTTADLLEIYGLTEGGPVTVLDARAYPDKLASVGRPSGACSLRVVDDAGSDLPAGEVGEVLGRSPNMMSGYLNRPVDTEALLVRDASGALYFRTGDLGRLDDDGFLYLLDRKKDVIISGGFNVFAVDLETTLAAHPAVAEVAVIGVPSERWGETPLALVVPKPGSDATAEELREFCNARVGKLQRVSAIELRSELPKNALGKTLKRELRAPYWTTPTPERSG
jgi:acyl-CoA synthetase (AMP-forming)/AMP-acid ligase II